MRCAGWQNVLKSGGVFGQVCVGAWCRRGYRGRAVGVADEVHLALAVLGPQIHVENIHGVVDFTAGSRVSMRAHRSGRLHLVYALAVHLLARIRVDDDQAHARRRGNGPPVFVTKAAHARSLGLLDNVEPTVLGVSTIGRSRASDCAKRTCMFDHPHLSWTQARYCAWAQERVEPGGVERRRASRAEASARGAAVASEEAFGASSIEASGAECSEGERRGGRGAGTAADDVAAGADIDAVAERAGHAGEVHGGRAQVDSGGSSEPCSADAAAGEDATACVGAGRSS